MLQYEITMNATNVRDFLLINTTCMQMKCWMSNESTILENSNIQKHDGNKNKYNENTFHFIVHHSDTHSRQVLQITLAPNQLLGTQIPVRPRNMYPILVATILYLQIPVIWVTPEPIWPTAIYLTMTQTSQ